MFGILNIICFLFFIRVKSFLVRIKEKMCGRKLKVSKRFLIWVGGVGMEIYRGKRFEF